MRVRSPKWKFRVTAPICTRSGSGLINGERRSTAASSSPMAAPKHCVGAGARPIDFLEIFSLAGGAGLEGEIAVLQQPGVEVRTAFEAGEAMIAEHEEDGILIDVRERLADEGIGAHVKFFDHAAVGAAAVFLGEEHVLHAIGGIEDTGHDSAACAIERAEELRLALFIGEVGLFEKGGVIDGRSEE